MGRHSDYTDEIAERFVEALRAFGFVNKAADFCRIDRGKVYRWLRRGQAGEEPYATFLADVLQAQAQVQLALKTSALTDPRQATWFLERMFPAEYGMKERVEQAAQEQLQHLLDSIIGELSDGAREELLAAVARHVGGAETVADSAADADGDVIEAEAEPEIKALPVGRE